MWDNCDTSSPDCETDLLTTSTHCGSCGMVCHGPCSDGTCTGECDEGEHAGRTAWHVWGLPAGRLLAGSGRSKQLSVLVALAQLIPFADPLLPGWGNCYASSPDCETDLQTSASNCGACGMTCQAHTFCSGSVCQGECSFWPSPFVTGASTGASGTADVAMAASATPFCRVSTYTIHSTMQPTHPLAACTEWFCLQGGPVRMNAGGDIECMSLTHATACGSSTSCPAKRCWPIRRILPQCTRWCAARCTWRSMASRATTSLGTGATKGGSCAPRDPRACKPHPDRMPL